MEIIPSGSVDDFADVINSYYEEFFWKDLQLIIADDGWSYLYDANTCETYSLDNYGYDYKKELMDGKHVLLYQMDEEVEE